MHLIDFGQSPVQSASSASQRSPKRLRTPCS